MDLISREDAKALGLKRFFTGVPCKNNHIAERYVSSGNCVTCLKERTAIAVLLKRESNLRTTSCPMCGTTIQTTNGLKKFCSKKCKRIWDASQKPRRGPITRSCLWCNRSLTTSHATQNFCCAEHSAWWHREDRKSDPVKAEKQKLQEIRWKEQNLELLRQKSREYEALNREERNAKARARRSTEEGRQLGNAIAKASRDRFREQHGISMATAHQRKNPNYKIGARLRKRIWAAVTEAETVKAGSFEELCGCSIEDLRLHLESLWKPGMSWDNYSFEGWHIDHIRPCASFDLIDQEQQKQCFHFTNLQPLWARENLSKSDKWEG